MKRRQILAMCLISLLGACALQDQTDPAEPAEAQTQQAAISYQGMSYQGTSYQAISYQGTSYQGASYTGTAYQGGSYSGDGSSLYGAGITGTSISVWNQNADGTWEQRFPNKRCHWDATKKISTCTTIDLATTPSPLAGTRWKATFSKDGTSFWGNVQIGASATQVGAVTTETNDAMFPINGSSSSCLTVACDNPAGCRTNCDLWLYDLRLVDVLDASGQPVTFCPAGQTATALSGLWDQTGQASTSTWLFTFACTNGTIEKCTRWGYRPWESDVLMSDNVTTDSLAKYHQACVRAATADYCSDGNSFTHDGTLVDVYDFPRGKRTYGFIPRVTNFAWESSWDAVGASFIDHTRFEEQSLVSACGSRIWQQSGDVGATWNRLFTPPEPPPVELVNIASAPACAHSERTVGRFLNESCSQCVQRVHDDGRYATATMMVYPNAYCTSATGAWDAYCVSRAQALCEPATVQSMTSHSECATGAGLSKYATGCTATLELQPAYAGCASTWSTTCVDAAKVQCTGGQDVRNIAGQLLTDFCGGSTAVTGGGGVSSL